MARPWSRKRNREAAEPATAPAQSPEDVRLDGDDHAWWAQTDVNQAWTPRARQPDGAAEEREILAEHFGDDWRTSFGVTPPSEEELTAEADGEQPALDDAHHPDRRFGRSEEE